MRVLFTFLISSFFMLPALASIDLDSFLNEVAKQDNALQGLILQKEGSNKSLEAADLPFESKVFARSSYLFDKRPTTNPSAQGLETKGQTLSVGLQQQTLYGVHWSLSQNFSHNNTIGASAAFLPQPNYYDSYPKVDLTLSLWRNFLGREARAEKSLQQKNLELTAKNIDLEATKRWIEAENTFFSFWAQDEIVKVKRDSVQHAEKLRKWAQDLRGKNLADKSDVFQADAAVLSRKLELESSLFELKEVSRNFNRLRGVEAGAVNEGVTVDAVNFQIFDAKAKGDALVRKDWSLQQASSDLLFAEVHAAREKIRPTLDFNLSAATIGRGNSFSDANSNAFQKNKFLQASVLFEFPLDQFKFYRVRDGMDQQKSAQTWNDLALNASFADQWKNFVEKGRLLREQLALIRALEQAQKNKAEAEQDKYNRGRSTTFQVISFQQDYFDVRTKRILLELQARTFLSQLKLFE